MSLDKIRARLIAWTSRRVFIGRGTKIEKNAVLNPRGGVIRIGKGGRIASGAMLLSQGGKITIGDHFSLNPYAVLYGHGGLTIGNWVRIAAHTVIVPSSHKYEDASLPIREQGMTRLGVTIEDDVWIGAGVVIVDGAHISTGCVIAAGAVVRGKTEPFCVYGGVPARLLKKRGAPTLTDSPYHEAGENFGVARGHGRR